MRATRPSYVTPPAYRPRLAAWVVGVCFFVSGATGLIYQNVWVRLMGLFYGNTTLAVSSVVAAFMAGLALGAWLIGGASDRVRRPLALYGLLEILIGAYGLLSPRLLDMARGYYVAEYGSRAADAQELALVQFGLCFICLVFPTALMGATLPILSAGLQRVLPRDHLAYAPPAEGVQALDVVWAPLDALAPPAKQVLVEALVEAASHDRRVSVAEAELLRTVCAASVLMGWMLRSPQP